MIADSVQSDGQPFAALSEAVLLQTKKAAEASITRQRIDMGGIQQIDPDEGVVEIGGIRLAPKSSGPTTTGPDWDGKEQAIDKQCR